MTMLLKRLSIVLILFFSLFTRPYAQINMQTGSAIFSLPIFDWHDTKSRLSSSIALSYNSGNGLKVNDMASNVGQGWNLIAGGVITRMQVGEPDDQPVYPGVKATSGQTYDDNNDGDVTKYPPGYLYNTVSPSQGCPTALTRYPTYGGQNVLYAQHNLLGEDKEQDYFSFSFNGKAGMFVLDQSGGDVGIPLQDSKMQITFQRDLSLTSQGIRTVITSFTITDVDGLVYKFTKHGLTRLLREIFSNADGSKTSKQPTISNGGVYCQGAFDLGATSLPWVNQYLANPYIISNWYLSEVDDPFTGAKILYNYRTLNLNVPAGEDISYSQSNNGGDNYVVISYKRSVTTTMELTSIVYPDGHLVTLNYSPTQRADYPGEYALASIDVQDTHFLDSHSQYRYLSKYLLNTTYFILNRYGTPTTTYQKSVSRLCLKSVQRIGVDLVEDSPPYIFDYYTGSSNGDDFVPPPFFYAKDIWGYYNGNNSVNYSNSTPVSLTASLVYNLGYDALKGLCFQHSGVSGTYYNAKPGYAQNGLLKQIIYPTGGSLTYTYTQNTGSFIGSSSVINVGGVHVSQTSSVDGGYSNGCGNPVTTQYNYVVNGTGSASSLWGMETPVNYVQSNNYWQEEHQTIKIFPPGCKWHYIYPGILSQYQAVSIEGWQKFMAAISPVLGVLSVISTIVDIVNVLGPATGVGEIVAVVIDVISTILSFILSCPQKTKTSLNTTFYNFDLNLISPMPAQFKRVEVMESPGSIGKTVQEFTHGDASDGNLGTDHYYPLWDAAGGNTAFAAKQRFAPWAYGLPWRTTVYDVNGNVIRQTQNVYDFSNAHEGIWDPNTCCANNFNQVANCKCQVVNSYSQRSDGWTNPSNYNASSPFVTSSNGDIIPSIYYFFTGHVNLSTTYERTYRTSDVSQYVQTEKDYTYGDGYSCMADNYCQPVYHNYDVRSIVTHQSNGDVDYKYMYYPGDYNTGILATLCQKNLLSEPVSTYSYVVKAHNFGAISYLSERVTEYGTLADGDVRPSRVLEQRFPQPQNSLTLYSGPTTTSYSPYKTVQTFTYDGNSNLVGMQDEGLRSVASIYDYSDEYVDATVINADPLADKIAYTSFEYSDLSRSGWSVSGSVQINVKSPSATGYNNFTLLASHGNSLISGALNSGKAYILSFWASGGSVAVSSGSTLVKTGPSYNGYTYYEYTMAAGSGSATLYNSAASNITIDEVRLYPSTARMKTATFDPLIGKTSECDENNRISYYSYDNLGRLQLVKDESGNIVKMYEYNNVSSAKQVGCPGAYTNKALSELIYRNNCSSGQQAGSYVFTIPAGTFTSTVSQQDADLQAELDLFTNGQTAANNNAACYTVYCNGQQQQTVTTTDCAEGYTGGSYTYTVPAGTYCSIVSQQDADNQALADITANAQATANELDNMNCTINTNPDWDWFPGDGTTPADPSYCLSVNGQLPPHLFVLATDINPYSSTYNQQQWFDYGPSDACPANTYFNAQQSQTFYKNNCGAGYAGSPVTYTVPPGKYNSTTSQAAADQQATNEINANGQNNANTNGTCISLNFYLRIEWTQNYTSYYPDGSIEEQSTDPVVRFYADAACTIPYTIPDGVTIYLNTTYTFEDRIPSMSYDYYSSSPGQVALTGGMTEYDEGFMDLILNDGDGYEVELETFSIQAGQYYTIENSVNR